MIDLERLADWMTELRPVRTETGLCLRARSVRSTCQECVKICPTGAITLAGQPTVDPEICTGCGLCSAACRTGALRMETPSDTTLLAAARKVQGGPVVLACSREAADLPAVVKSRLVVVPCLGCLTAELLAGMLATGQDRLVLWQPATCTDCPNGAESGPLVQAAAAAMAELYPGSVTFGGSAGLLAARLSTGSGSAAPGHGGASSLDQQLAGQDRRAFLAGVVKNAPGVVAMLFGDWMAKPKAEPPKPAPIDVQAAPRRRQMLLEAMAVRPPSAGATLPDRMVAVTSACTLCPACSRLCPSGALQLTVDDGSATLWWQASQCTSCGLCRSVCPSGAMTQGERLTATQFRAREPVAIMTGEAAECACGSSFWRTPGGSSSCVACRLRSKES